MNVANGGGLTLSEISHSKCIKLTYEWLYRTNKTVRSNATESFYTFYITIIELLTFYLHS